MAPIYYGINNVKVHKIIFEEQKRDDTVEWYNTDFTIVWSKPEEQSIDKELNRKMAIYYIHVSSLKIVYTLNEEK
ncbi:hypothetical protein [Carboxylicivirga litoralis]|uniref:hypothetical protein n=1 Tax=Carboxylicivirga litoralis TaxID=2816963 RepID=UPI0021CB02F2|nr:hypothetical protein [Carboxylicivirga sp. A043]